MTRAVTGRRGGYGVRFGVDPGCVCPCPVLGLARQRSASCMAQARGLLSVCYSRGTLVSRTCAWAVAAPSGKACRVTAKVLRGSFGAIQEQSVQDKETRPRQEELAGKANRGISRNLPRAPRVPARPGERQASGRDKTTAAASYHSVPTLQHIHQHVALGSFQARVARGCAASGARWQATLTRLPSCRAVAPLTVTFCTV